MKDTLLHVELSIPMPVESGLIYDKSWLLHAIATYKDRSVLAFGGHGTTKHENMGRIAADLKPDDDGTYLLELGAVLADRLPSLNEQQEYCLSVPAVNPGDPKDVCFSNQMVRVRFLRNHDFYHIMCPLYRLRTVQEDRALAPENAHVEYLQTVATCRYRVPGSDAEEALSDHLDHCIGDFIGRINRVLAGHLMVAAEHAGILTPSYDYGTFDHIYLFMRGADPEVVHGERLILSLFRAALVAQNYDTTVATRFTQYVSGQEAGNDVLRLLRSAKSYIEGGVLHLALLQLAIAAEIATTRYIHAEYIRRGVSKNKLDDRKAEITFSIMLNIELIALAPDGQKPESQLIGQIDRIRRLRNELMHSGSFASSTDDLRKLHEAVRRFVSYIEAISPKAA